MAILSDSVPLKLDMQGIILCTMHWFPFKILRLRVSQANEEIGIDESEMGEFAYDYVFLQSELRPEEYQRPVANGAFPLQDMPAAN